MSKDNWPERNKLQTWFLDVFPKYFLLLILIGCVVIAIYALLGPAVGYVYSNIYTGGPFCMHEVTAKVWLDTNANGIADGNELPLSSTRISIDDNIHISDQLGVISTTAIVDCRTPHTHTISLEPPLGYFLTTSGTFTITVIDTNEHLPFTPLSSRDAHYGPFLFGLAPLSETLTPTPASRK